MRNIEEKIISIQRLIEIREKLKSQNQIVVFTNGCFDILHAGHVEYLVFARRQGDVLIVAVNSDESVRRIKGSNRPFNKLEDRMKLLAALECVDYVTWFDESEPESIIKKILPDVLVKGEDWAHYVSGADVVIKNGGKVILAPLKKGYSTSNLIKLIKSTE